MARPPRNEEPGATYHVFARGVNRVRVFVDEEDYQRYTRLLAATIERYGWYCLTYCLMPNHVHLLIETPEPTLGAGMQRLHGLYAQTFNERHDRVGHLFQDRFKSPRIADESQFVTTIGYIALNPVAAAFCERPEDWQWSSHHRVSSARVPAWLAHDRLLNRLQETTGTRCYSDVVEARMRLTID